MAYSDEVLADTPLVYYKLDEASGTSAADSSGNGSTATHTNSPTVGAAGLLGDTAKKAAVYTRAGTTPYTLSGNVVSGATNFGTFAIEAWIKPASLPGGVFQEIFGLTPGDVSLKILNSTIRGAFRKNDGTGAHVTLTTTAGDPTVSIGSVYHVVYEANGTDANLYINGVLKKTTATAFGLENQNAPMGWLVSNTTSSIAFNGTIDECAFYDHALGSTRVLAHYNAGIAVPSLPPAITSVTPSTGTTLGGTSVAIVGTDFTSANDVDFGTTNAASFVVNSSTSISAVSPAHAAGVVDVRVTTPTGTSAITSADEFTYVLLTPTISSLSTSSGSTAGGTAVNITGTNFIGVTSVKFGTTEASFVVNSSTSIAATSPAHAVGAVDVSVTTGSGTNSNTSADDFTYTLAPTISTVTPNTGPVAGGTEVEISGSSLTTVSAIKFGTTDASSFVVNSDASITATTPGYAAGLTNVTATSPAGTSVPATFTFTTIPSIDLVSPDGGSTSGGNSVTITGVQFTGATSVKFGTTSASFVLNSDTEIEAIAPAHNPGTVNVRITTPEGTN